MSEGNLSVRVQVPATTANLGPGFDVAGMALGVYNRFHVQIIPGRKGLLEVIARGEDEGKIPRGPNNLVVRAMNGAWKAAGWEPEGGLRVEIENSLPCGRGLGSSATAIVGGLVAANYLMGNRLSQRQVLELATAMEGHPDNVAAALLGGVTVAVATPEGQLVDWIALEPPKVRVVAGIPDFQLPTRVARKALPPQVAFADAVFNVGRASLLIAALAQGRLDLLGMAMEDRLHQPYRRRLVPGMERAFEAARKAGALGVALSGAGPTVLAFVPPDDDGAKVGRAMQEAFMESGVACRLGVYEPDREGTRVLPPEEGDGAG